MSFCSLTFICVAREFRSECHTSDFKRILAKFIVIGLSSCSHRVLPKKIAGSLASKSMCDNRDGVVKVEEEAECKIIQREKRGRYLNYLIESSGDKI